MEQISIVFSKSTAKIGFFSRLIMLSEKTPYSHVAVSMVDDETGQTIYYQASHTMVNEMAEAEFLAQEKIIDRFVFRVDLPIKLAAKKFAIESLGKPYGVLSIIGLAYVQITRWLGFSVHNPFKENGATYVCDQFILTMLSDIGVLPLPANINDLTPKDIYPIVAALPQTWQTPT